MKSRRHIPFGLAELGPPTAGVSARGPSSARPNELSATNSLKNVAVICTPGLEIFTRQELTSAGVTIIEPDHGRAENGLLECEIDTATLFRLNYELRTASRLLVRLGEFNAAAFSELRKKASRMPWKNYLHAGQSINVRVTTHNSKLYHKKGISERVAGAISDALGKETKLVSADQDDETGEAPMVVVRLIHNFCAISIDSSGAHLHRRGYRLHIAKAPLRENLAASLLIASGWPGHQSLIDPFCGSGTIPIEAAMIAAGLPPGRNRKFAFQDWPIFERETWKQVLNNRVVAPALEMPFIAGSDRDAGAIKASRANAERAGVEAMIDWKCRSISDLELPPSPGWIVTNPPYGERVQGGPDLRNLYARMGSVWRQHGSLWHIYLLTSSPKWSGQLGMPSTLRARFNNGGIPVIFLQVNKPVDAA